MSRQPYPSDLSDAEWQLIEPLLPPAKSDSGRGRKRTVDLREILNAIFYWLRAGCAWNLLPHDFPPSDTVYCYWRKWQKQGVWEQINQVLREQCRQQEGRNAEPSAAIIDSQSVKGTEKGGKTEVSMETRKLMVVSGTSW